MKNEKQAMEYGVKTGFMVIGLFALVAGCSQEKAEPKTVTTHALEIAGVCQDIHVRQPFEYKGSAWVSTVLGGSISSPDRVTVGRLMRAIETDALVSEALARAQNLRLYTPPSPIKLWAENDEIVRAQLPYLMSGTAAGKNSGDSEVIVDCTFTSIEAAPLPK